MIEWIDDDQDPGVESPWSERARLTEAESGWGNSGSRPSSESVTMKISIPRKQGMETCPQLVVSCNRAVDGGGSTRLLVSAAKDRDDVCQALGRRIQSSLMYAVRMDG